MFLPGESPRWRGAIASTRGARLPGRRSGGLGAIVHCRYGGYIPADPMATAKKEKPDLSKKVHDVPHKPGVYLMRDRFNRVIYVGKARDLRKRVASYFLPSKLAVADIKTRAMLDAVWDFETHIVRSEAESILLEGKLIKEYRPRYNISFRDDKRFLLVKVDMTEEWPRFRLARFKKDDSARYFGPYAHAGALRQTLNFMRKKFGVLTFGRGSPTQRELKSSTYQVPIRLSEISATIYRERVGAGLRISGGAFAGNDCGSGGRNAARGRRRWISKRRPNCAT